MEYRPVPPPFSQPEPQRTPPQTPISPALRWASVALVTAASFLAVELGVIALFWFRLGLPFSTGLTWVLYALIAALILGGVFSFAGTAYLEFYVSGQMRLKDIPKRERLVETVQVKEEIPDGERLELMGYDALLRTFLDGEKADRRELAGNGTRWTQGQFAKLHQIMAGLGVRSDRKWLDELPATHPLAVALRAPDPSPEVLGQAADLIEAMHRFSHTFIAPEADHARLPMENGRGSRRIELQ